jgi:DNA polymerase III alpha subunit
MSDIKFSNCNCLIKRGEFSINNIPLDCPATWNLISSGYTIGVFQLEKKLGQDWARKVKPANIEELAALVALLRPGPLEAGMAQDYVDVKFMKKKLEYLHPSLEPILKSTYGSLVYQEQAIRIAVEFAGFNLEKADWLRKAIGKKDTELMAEVEKIFIDGIKSTKKISEEVGKEIFGWIKKCQRYSFNKSHAVSYAMIGYQTAWLKCHFPHEFFASYLTHSHYKSDPKEEIYRLVQDARLFDVEILPPDIRRGNTHFELVDDSKKAVAFGLSHIRSVGQAAIKKITDAGKSLETWEQFLAAVPTFHRNIGEALIKSGACDYYNLPRSEMIRELQAVLGSSSRNDSDDQAEVKGLTQKELKWFYSLLEDGLTTREALSKMSEPIERPKAISQMKKGELLALIEEKKEDIESLKDVADINKLKKSDLTNLAKESGYNPSKTNCLTEKRREAVLDKIEALKIEINDTNRALAAAEKHFLGISLSCSAADDADNDLATHTCLDVPRARNGESMTICAIIDAVKHTKTKRGSNPGQKMCFLTISDSTYSIDHAVVFPDVYRKISTFCKKDLIVLVYGTKRQGSFIVEDIQKLI